MTTTATKSPDFKPLTGSCNCGTVTYKLVAPPLINHCCHCTWCQRESGTAFALNLFIEAYNFKITSSAQPIIINAPSESSAAGDRHLIAHCPKCYVALYGHYGGHKYAYFVKAGTLDDESRAGIRPSVHIFTSTKMEWVNLSHEVEKGVKVFEGYYPKHEEVWSKESMERRAVWLEWVEEQKAVEKAKSEVEKL